MSKLYRLFAICFFFGVLSPQVGALGNPEFVFSEDGQGGVLFIKALDIDDVKTFENIELELDFTTSTFTLKKIVAADTTIPDDAIETVTKEGMTFGIRGCVAESRSVTCHFLITSIEFDRTVEFCGNRTYFGPAPSAGFDNFGNQYSPTKITIGNIEGTSYIRGQKLVADVTTRATIRFENFSTQATSISLLDLNFAVGRTDLSIQFRDIPF